MVTATMLFVPTWDPTVSELLCATNSSSFALHGLNERAGAEQAKDGSLFRQLVASQPILLISEIERARAGAGRPSVIDASGNGIKLCYGSGLQIWNKIVD